jgi:hypothetical protein
MEKEQGFFWCQNSGTQYKYSPYAPLQPPALGNTAQMIHPHISKDTSRQAFHFDFSFLLKYHKQQWLHLVHPSSHVKSPSHPPQKAVEYKNEVEYYIKIYYHERIQKIPNSLNPLEYRAKAA